MTPEQLARLAAEAEARGDFAAARRWTDLLRLACVVRQQRRNMDTPIEQRHWVSTAPVEYWLVQPGEELPADAIISVPDIVPGYNLAMRPINPKSEKGKLHA